MRVGRMFAVFAIATTTSCTLLGGFDFAGFSLGAPPDATDETSSDGTSTGDTSAPPDARLGDSGDAGDARDVAIVDAGRDAFDGWFMPLDPPCDAQVNCSTPTVCYESRCRLPCTTVGAACANGGVCVFPTSRGNVTSTTSLCTSPCSLLDTTTCPYPASCDYGGSGYVSCQSSGNAIGATFPWQCMGGLRTVYDGGVAPWDCLPWCRLDAGDCKDGGTCSPASIDPQHLSPIVNVNGVPYGVCL